MANTVHAPWMTAPPTRAVVEALSAEGTAVRFVGGPIRDALLGRTCTDIDIGTPDLPQRVMALLERAGIETHTVPRGIAHGTVIADCGGSRFEITTLRRDVRTDGRHAEVEFTDDWRADAARRDFTINAMSATPEGALHDYFGGREDLEAGRVRFVGDPATRIAEDYLRLLRFFRFHAWHGQGEPDAAALAACAAAAHTIPLLSGERVRDETMKLLASPDPVPAVLAMQGAGVLAVLLPEVQDTGRLANLVEIELSLAEADPIRRLASLIDGAANTMAVSSRWRLTGAESVRLAKLAAALEARTTDLDHRIPQHLLYESGPAHIQDLYLLAWASQDEAKDDADLRVMLKSVEGWEKPKFPIDGTDVLALGIEAGPEVGRLLREVEDWWIDRDFAPDREAALKKLDALVAERR